MAQPNLDPRDDRDDRGQNRYTTLGGNEGQVRHRGREGDAHYVGGPGFGNYGYGAGGPGFGALHHLGEAGPDFAAQHPRPIEQRDSYAGRGPKGWSRKDERIMEDVCQRLTDHPGIDASDIEVRVEGGEVSLAGTVDSRYTKRLTEDVAERVSGVRDVHNQLRVKQAPTPPPGDESRRAAR